MALQLVLTSLPLSGVFHTGFIDATHVSARCLLLLPLRLWHLNNLRSWNSVVLYYSEHGFVINLLSAAKLWDVRNDLCYNLWAHLRVGVVYAILEECGFYRGFTRGTTGACWFGSELPSNEDQCTRAQYFCVVLPHEWIGEVCIWFVETIPNVPEGNAVPLMISVCCFSLLFKLMFNLIVIIVIALSNARPTSFMCGLVKLELVSVEKFKN